MYRVFIIKLLIVLSILSSQVSGESPNEKSKPIPLDKIWAYEMPGTKDVRKLEWKLGVNDPNFKKTFHKSLIRQIISYLSSGAPRDNEVPRPGFVVIGMGNETLKKAHVVLKDRHNIDRQQQVPKNAEISLVFFHYVTGWHPKLTSVQQSHDSIVVKYQFVQPEEPSSGAASFAFIPLGKMSPGTVTVRFEEEPPVTFAGLKSYRKTNAEQLVCDSFSFEVK